MKNDVVEAVSNLLREKGIEKETFQEIIESVFFSMIKRKYGDSENFSVIFNPEKGDIEIQCIREVVEDGKVENPAEEIGLSEALRYDPYAELGEETMVLVDYELEFGRRIITSAKQLLIQRIREIEKDNLYQEFSQRIGEIVIGDVHQIKHNEIRLNIDKTEVILPRDEQVYSEHYRRGETIKAIVIEVRKTSRDPEIIVSRKSKSFVKRLFELEVPEIFDGIIEIKAIAREAGERTKLAVESNDKRVDPVGACVGMKGVRIQAIVKELNREKIDIIHWTNDQKLLIRRALAPIIPLELVFSEEGNKVVAVIQDDQMPQVIGRRGQNIRVASNLTEYDIEPVRMSEYYQEELDLTDVEGLTEDQIILFQQEGFRTAEDILNMPKEDLLKKLPYDVESLNSILDILNSYFEDVE